MHYVFLLAFALVLTACSTADIPGISRVPSPRDLPFIHKIDIQQGNVVTQDMLAQLTPEMEKKKVLFIMGSPVIEDTFHADRWDYLYTFEPGGGSVERRLITLYFKDDKLDRIEGGVRPAEAPLVATLHHDTTVRVPKFKKKNIITKVVDALPFVEESEDVIEEDEAAEGEDGKVVRDDNMPAVAKTRTPARSAYEDIQAGPGEGIVVPPDAPGLERKRGFFSSLFDSIGLAAKDDGSGQERELTPADPRFRDVREESQR